MRGPILALLILGAAAHAHAAVTVTHGDPDRFTDAGDRSSDPVKIMQAIEMHLKRLGERYLPAGTDLRIEVIDVDRAGRTRMNLPTEMRIVNGKADMPCIEMRYEVVTNGAASPAKKERVCDPDFLRQLGMRDNANDPLVYEKRMLDDWFRERFSVPGAKR